MIRTSLVALLATTALAVSGCAGGAGSTQQGDASRPLQASGFSAAGATSFLTADEAVRFSKQVERDLAAKGARVAIVFRSGRPRSDLPDGIRYTHGAFWLYVPITLDDGRVINGYAVYNLYHGDGDSLPKTQSYLHQDFPIDFVAATGVDDVAVIVPTPEMQRRIVEKMSGPDYANLHRANYSLVSNPLDAKYQNCNEFMLDVIASATWETMDITQIKANLRASYKPTRVKTNLVERLFGPIADSRLKTDDQSGPIVTATYSSMAKFMADNGLSATNYVIERDKSSAAGN